VFLVGLLTGLVAFGINLAVENVAGLKFVYTVNLMNTNRFVLAFVLYAGVNMILVMLAAMLCVYVGPSAAGSGIPEVKAYLNGVDTPNVFSLNTLIVKVSTSLSTSSLTKQRTPPMLLSPFQETSTDCAQTCSRQVLSM
jgi:chloride channel 7